MNKNSPKKKRLSTAKVLNKRRWVVPVLVVEVDVSSLSVEDRESLGMMIEDAVFEFDGVVLSSRVIRPNR